MSRGRLALLAAVVVVAMLACSRGDAVVAGEPGAAPPSTTVLDNDFIPENRNLSDCISAVPKPDCGSEARGGWHQGLVFLVLLGGLAFIGWRIVRGAGGARSAPGREEPVDDPR